MTLIRCDYPPADLWPNGRPNRHAKTRKTKSYRALCAGLAQEQSVHMRKWPTGDILVHLTFHPKKGGRPDDDNLEAAFKAGRDGIADAMGVDDGNFVVTREIGASVQGGCVLVQIITEPLADSRTEKAT